LSIGDDRSQSGVAELQDFCLNISLAHGNSNTE
jgi:hypothetical protein